MPLGNWSVEWLNLNMQRAYPLADRASGVDATGTFTLPTDFLVEIDLPVQASIDIDPARFFIYSLAIYTSGVFLTIGYDTGGIPTLVANAQIQPGAEGYSVFPLIGINSGVFRDTVGKVTVASFESLNLQPPGYYLFEPAATRLDVDTVRPQLRCVSSLTLVNGTDKSLPITGDVELVAGSNIRLTLELSSGLDPQIRIDAISGVGLNNTCECVGRAAELPCVTRINGIPAAPDGSFTLVGDECLEITSISGGITIRDKCAKPCCGCAELETITRDLARYKSQQDTLTAFVSKLEAVTSEMDLVVLGSRLGDRGCVTC